PTQGRGGTPRGAPAYQGVDRVRRVHDAAASAVDDTRQRPRRGKVPGRAHTHGEGLEPGFPRPLHEASTGLSRHEDAPATLARPTRLRNGPHLLASEAGRGLGVEHRLHAARAFSTARATEATEIARMHT